MPLRFPNPGSDIPRMLRSFRLIHDAANTGGIESFDIDFTVEVMVSNFQASSRGAVGNEALARSAELDRSRDPLYNQMKSYSEIYRMLGWFRPHHNSRSVFNISVLGDVAAQAIGLQSDFTFRLLRECLMAVTFPNPTTHNVGISNLRPFRWLLRLIVELGGVVTRDEIILGLLSKSDDRGEPDLSPTAERIRRIRAAGRASLTTELNNYATASEIQLNTLRNYTRLPMALLRSPDIGWGQEERLANLYGRSTPGIRLTALGLHDANWLETAHDIRESDLENYSLDERACFANFSYYTMLARAGVDPSHFALEMKRAEVGCASMLDELCGNAAELLLYSPVQQASDSILSRSLEIEQESA